MSDERKPGALMVHDELVEAIGRVAETIVDQAKGDLTDALLLWRALVTDLYDLIKRKAKARSEARK